MVTAIIAAAGQGKRMGRGINKVFIPLINKPVLVRSIQAVAACKAVDNMIVVAAEKEINMIEDLLTATGKLKPWQVIGGGSERQHSIANALKVVPDATEFILVHDAARPLVGRQVIDQVIECARQYGAAGVAVPVKDTVKVVDGEGFIVKTPERNTLWAMQTPQVFAAGVIRKAYKFAAARGYLATDDAALVEQLGIRVKIVAGDYRNIKITTPDDLTVAGALLTGGRISGMTKYGIGYDVHRLTTGRRLILGGIDVPFNRGLAGHSDADVLIHAIIDALLGAAGLGDIGRHFPDNDSKYKDISSLKLLSQTRRLIDEAGYQIDNIDSTIVAQKPRLADYLPGMQQNIAAELLIEENLVNIKATTTEGLGFTGREEGIAAYAVASLTAQQSFCIKSSS